MAVFEALPKAVKPKDLTGLRFGNLLVLDFSHRQRTKYATRIFWNCQCDCGSIRQVQTYHLTNDEVKSCGKCIYAKANRSAATKKLPFGIGTLKAFFRNYKSNAKTKNRAFEIDFDLYYSIVIKNCHYCGRPPSIRHTNKAHHGGFAAHGLDRVDSSKAYLIDNVVTCCSQCNTMKLDMTYEEFKAHIKRIALHLKVGSL